MPYNTAMRGFLGNPRRVLIVVHDLVVTALAILATLYVRFGDGQNGGLDERYPWLVIILPGIVLLRLFWRWITRWLVRRERPGDPAARLA